MTELNSNKLKAGLSATALLAVITFAQPAFSQPQQAAQTSQQNFNATTAVQAPATEAPVQAIPDGGQQLPNGFAQQQVPSSFSLGDETPTDAPSDQIIPATTDGDAENGEVVQQPGNVPVQPATQQLVPATAMGAAAQQNVNNGSGNSVEDAAAAMDAQIQAEQQAQEQENVAADDASDVSSDGDALPEVNDTTMVKLKANFPNSAGRTAYGEVDGSLDGENDPVAQKALKDGIRRDAFDAAITGMFPLSPDQIKTLIGKYDETQKAVDAPPYDAPKPEISVTNISLDPGVMPPTIKTAVGNVTTLNILDATGAPWPVQDVTWAGDFEIVEPEQGGHIIRITPMAQFARGNIVIRLLTLKTPLTLTLETSREVVQYRVDARVPEYGPFANAPLMQGGKSMVAGDATLTGLLDGVAGTGMVKLNVSGVDGRTTAYASGGQTYVRTPLTLLSPAWKSSVSSADGMNVYVLSSAPVLLLSDEGEFLRATLTEKEDLLDE